MKKFVSLLLALLMLAVMLPATAMAAPGLSGEVNYPTGVTEESFGTNTIYVDMVTGDQNYFDKLETALEAAQSGATMYCKANAAIASDLSHPDFYKNITVYGNGADFQKRENNFGTTGAGYKYPAANSTITVNIYNAKNFAVWGQPSSDNIIWNITMKNCANDGKYFLMFRGEASDNSVMNFTLIDCKYTGVNDKDVNGIHITADGSVTVTNCEFNNCSSAINANHKQNDALTLNISDNTFTNCGFNYPTDDYYAPVRLVNSGNGSVDATIENNTFSGTVAGNGDIRLGDQRTGKTSNTVNATIINSSNQDITVRNGNPGDTEPVMSTVPAKSQVMATNNDMTEPDPIEEDPTTPGTITIIVPSTEEPKPADDQKNPATGANDFVGVAAAAAVMALLGSAVVLRKK